MKKTIIILATTLLTSCGIQQVDEGFRGIYTSWGKVTGEPLQPGLHYYNPVSADIFEMDVRENKWEGEEKNPTKEVVESHN